MSISTSRWRRSARLLGLPAAASGDRVVALARRARGDEAEEVRRWARDRNAQRTRRVLGDLKGGPLKAGQLLSTVEALMPQDPDDTWRSALTELQENNPGVPFAELRPTLVDELGPGWRDRFATFDERPVAAASLGQVHRGEWADGRPVAVKIQYPGVADALAGDVQLLAVSLRLTTLVARGLALPPLVAELRTRLADELDYIREGNHQDNFAREFADDPDVVVPAVLLATPRVLVTDWLDAQPLAQVAVRGSKAERDHLGRLYQRFFLMSPERVGLLHTDPHPGNFRLTPDGRLGVLDFGSVLPMPHGMPGTFGRLIAALLHGDDVAVLRRLGAEGFLRPGRTVDTRKLRDYLAPFTEPAAHEEFTYSRTWLKSQFGRVNDPRNPDFAVALAAEPPGRASVHPSGLARPRRGPLSSLGATVPVAPELRRWLPGFTDASR